MLGVKNNREPIKGDNYKKLKAELENVEITPEYNGEDETLVLNINMKMHKPIEKFEMTFDKPEGMTDEQFKVFIAHLEKDIENYNVHEGELTS